MGIGSVNLSWWRERCFKQGRYGHGIRMLAGHISSSQESEEDGYLYSAHSPFSSVWDFSPAVASLTFSMSLPTSLNLIKRSLSQAPFLGGSRYCQSDSQQSLPWGLTVDVDKPFTANLSLSKICPIQGYTG